MPFAWKATRQGLVRFLTELPADHPGRDLIARYGGVEKAASLLSTFLAGLGDERNALWEEDNVLNIVSSLVSAGLHPESLADCYEFLALITDAGELHPEVEKILQADLPEVAHKIAHIKAAVVVVQAQKDKLLSETVKQTQFRRELTHQLQSSLKHATREEARSGPAAAMVGQVYAHVGEAFKKAHGSLQAMYQKREHIYAARKNFVVGVATFILSGVNMGAIPGLLTIVSSDSTSSFSDTFDTLSPAATNLKNVGTGADSFRTAYRDLQDAAKPGATPAALNAALNGLWQATINYSVQAYQNLAPVDDRAIEDAISGRLDHLTAADYHQFMHQQVGGGIFSVEQGFIRSLSAQLEQQLRPGVNNEITDPTLRLIMDASTRDRAQEAIFDQAMRMLYIQGKYAEAAAASKQDDVIQAVRAGKWNQVRDLVYAKRFLVDVRDSSGLVLEQLQRSFPELRARGDQFFYAKGKDLSLDRLGVVSDAYEQQVSRRTGWEIASGALQGFLQEKKAISPYSLSIEDWQELLSTTYQETMRHFNKFTAAGKDNYLALYSITPISILASSPVYLQAFKTAMEKADEMQKAAIADQIFQCNEKIIHALADIPGMPAEHATELTQMMLDNLLLLQTLYPDLAQRDLNNLKDSMESRRRALESLDDKDGLKALEQDMAKVAEFPLGLTLEPEPPRPESGMQL